MATESQIVHATSIMNKISESSRSSAAWICSAERILSHELKKDVSV
jgi:hypothetical protein